MATWRDLGQINARAAALLARDREAYRAAVSRAYYAVYHEVTHLLVESGYTDFGALDGKPRKNPNHKKVARLAGQNIGGLTENKRRDLRKAMTRLRGRREDADYRPGASVDQRVVRDTLRDMYAARRVLSTAGGGER